MLKLFLVGAGGFIGASSRYLLHDIVQRSTAANTLPYGTLAVNLVGCIFIGIAEGVAESRGMFSPETRALVIIGILGGFTTFSTFGFDTHELIRSGQMGSATANIFLNVVLCLAGVWFGHSLARMM